jgi:8-oxo-dGTP pyrophosphatase MutT (NUDIX family)
MVIFDDAIVLLKRALSNDLPGIDAHRMMAPDHRKPASEYLKEVKSYKTGCVMALLFPSETGEATLVLMERTGVEGDVHAHQVSFPGGKVEEGDEGFLMTALREVHEEVGVSSAEINVLGALTELYIPPSNFLVYPFVGYVSKRPDYNLSVDEVKNILEVPLSFFLASENKKETTFSSARGYSVKAPYYDYSGIKIWGATAMMIAELVALIESRD